MNHARSVVLLSTLLLGSGLLIAIEPSIGDSIEVPRIGVSAIAVLAVGLALLRVWHQVRSSSTFGLQPYCPHLRTQYIPGTNSSTDLTQSNLQSMLQPKDWPANCERNSKQLPLKHSQNRGKFRRQKRVHSFDRGPGRQTPRQRRSLRALSQRSVITSEASFETNHRSSIEPSMLHEN